jgi:hypothetical protein
VEGAAWEQIGPAPATQLTTGTVMSGRVHQVAFASQSTWYAATAHGGIWKTEDGGANWSPLTDRQVSLSSSTVVVDPDPNKASNVWAGTGEAECTSFDSFYGAGILYSTDGGNAWTRTGASEFGAAVISKIALDPSSSSNSRRLYAAASTCSTDFRRAGATTGTGLFKSTDGGASWTRLTAFGANGVQADDVLVTSNGTIFATRFRDTTAANRGIYRSIDQGATFTRVSTGLPAEADWSNIDRMHLAWACATADTNCPESQTVVYAMLEDSRVGQPFGLYRSTNGGITIRSRPPLGAAVRPREP